jgi:glycyl-tRNA synthetase beta chain
MTRAGRSFLLEIGTEEIPARMLPEALDSLARRLRSAVDERELLDREETPSAGKVRTYGTPRRLAVRIDGLRERQPDKVVEVTGPPAKAAYDSSGRPTRAAEGFARAQGVAVAALRRIATPRGECLGVRREVRGSSAAEVLAEVVPHVVGSMTFPKMMRWGSGEHRFVRPVHSVLALLGESTVDMTIAGIRSGNDTFGHRFAGEARIAVRNIDDYPGILRDNGVLADVEERRRHLEEQLAAAARRSGGRIAPPPGAPSGAEGDPELLQEVVHLVEWPLVVEGEFDPAFLQLPAEILVTAMRHHQKYFSLLSDSGGLQNRFLAVANCRSDPSGAIGRGNAWVLHARLADARFFWDDDRRTSLMERVAALERVTFHMQLGSYRRKTDRIGRLCERLAAPFRSAGLEPDDAALRQAALLSKADLTSQMVGEFPELQGIVGALYARAESLAPATAQALYEQYRPAAAEDATPSSIEGAILSLADRIDTQAGIFLLGLVPSGSSDPYGLRRSVLGACRILIERQVHLPLAEILTGAIADYAGDIADNGIPPARALRTLLDFYRARLQFLGEEAGLRQDSARAALAIDCDGPFDAVQRMRALDAIRSDTEFDNLATAHKRIKKITQGHEISDLHPGLLNEQAEKDLHAALQSEETRIEAAVAQRDYVAVLRSIARLRPLLDRFFDDVMVMAEDLRLRNNRIALLQQIAALFQRIGDFSEIAVASDRPPMQGAAAKTD